MEAPLSSDLTFMSKNESWLLGLMDLGANFKISMFDPPGVRPAYFYHLGSLSDATCRMRRPAFIFPHVDLNFNDRGPQSQATPLAP